MTPDPLRVLEGGRKARRDREPLIIAVFVAITVATALLMLLAVLLAVLVLAKALVT